METFTEEQAKEKLEELGFDVVDARDARFVGYSIEQDLEHDCYVVYELMEYGYHGALRANLSGWGAGFTLTEALSWLQGRIKEGR